MYMSVGGGVGLEDLASTVGHESSELGFEGRELGRLGVEVDGRDVEHGHVRGAGGIQPGHAP